MDVITFQTQYNAGRQTMGTTAPVPPPVMLTYLYRAFMPHMSNSQDVYGAFPALPARSPNTPPIIQ
jgi:hypothetical protein